MDALIILDGFGISNEHKGNAIYANHTNGGTFPPNFQTLWDKYPHTEIEASGEAVGLPDGQMGNSEVGHLNIGAGRVIYQDLTKITKSIKDGDFFTNPAFLKVIESCKKNGKALHLYGLLSDGGVHSHIEHVFALVKLAKDKGLSDVFVHAFLDGRDVPPSSGADYLKQLQDYMDGIGFGTIASVSGRFYAMDRDNRWDRVEKAYSVLTDTETAIASNQTPGLSAEALVRKSYGTGVTDEFVLPVAVYKNGKIAKRIEKGDGIIFYNFRPDRAREITRAFIEESFDNFVRKTGYLAPCYVGFAKYDEKFTNISTAFEKQEIKNNLGQYLSSLGKKQLRIAETEKYAHVTFFFNSGIEAPEVGEDRELIASPKVATYDLKPEMSAYEVKDRAVDLIKSGKYDVMILNFANCDMVGHTAVEPAVERAVKAVDECLKEVVDAVLASGGSAIITADHGNAEKLLDEDGNPFTAHTTNPVPLVIAGQSGKLRSGGILADIAPTLLKLMGLPIPKEFEGKSLI
ncbi:MAG: 2,3-bisphosphoglycerate-independent phosphoglycerate mutase [Christensenellaceae bacterium]|jgi:2,3-bisphosphoglycerate-independent phosphoglycerate mutase|nr:2,3-bisphosphoglycerate-independent phosphoglycerate mutase [Christensenellaceae bacterium]